MIVKLKKIDPRAVTPYYGTDFAAGADLCAVDSAIIPARGHLLVHTGIAIELPQGHEAQVRPRSGLAFKKGVTVLNGPGTIDEDYRGEVGVILVNHSDVDYTVEPGDRIAQLVIKKYEQYEFTIVDELSESVRGGGGFGSTGA